MYQFLCVVYILLVNKQFDIYKIHTSGIYIYHKKHYNQYITVRLSVIS